ncbi:MAG: 2-amino-4-hydroxy-6-hydroxymethyldihydropteridine diphosphokinase [Bacteroidota bacterium]|nr:2-amino-4-hydroxy-6-hydroxymethyldihydropteridine diphosphokinase [Bacteroidota bacterium]
MNNAYLQLGTNLGDRKANLNFALSLIKESIGHIEIESSIYESEPWGFSHETTFLNQVINVSTVFSSNDLLQKCQEIEKILGRVKTKQGYEARIIDIDILFFNWEIIKTEKLIVPHQHIQDRRFVLLPLSEIAPLFLHPILKRTITELLGNCVDKLWVRKV